MKSTAEADNKQSLITSLTSSVNMWCCDASRAEIDRLITKMRTGDMLLLRFVEGACFHKLMPFAEPKNKQPLWQTKARVEKMRKA